MTPPQRKQWWFEFGQGNHKSPSLNASPVTCCPMGVPPLLAFSLAEALGVWLSIPTTSSCATTCYNSSEDGYTSGDSDDSTDVDRRVFQWAIWDTFVKQLGLCDESCCMANRSSEEQNMSVRAMPFDSNARWTLPRHKLSKTLYQRIYVLRGLEARQKLLVRPLRKRICKKGIGTSTFQRRMGRIMAARAG